MGKRNISAPTSTLTLMKGWGEASKEKNAVGAEQDQSNKGQPVTPFGLKAGRVCGEGGGGEGEI